MTSYLLRLGRDISLCVSAWRTLNALAIEKEINTRLQEEEYAETRPLNFYEGEDSNWKVFGLRDKGAFEVG